MKAVVCYGNSDIRYEDVPDVKPKENEIRIKVMACGICGSDIPRAIEMGAHNYPIILGHEFSGIVDLIGAKVNLDIKLGDRVTAAPLLPCFICDSCKMGNYSLCDNYSFIGSRCQGAMAECICVPAENIIKFSDDISFECGALFEPASVALHAVKKYISVPKKNAAIIGGGTIGLFVLQWMKIFGCTNVVVFGRDKEHLQLAKDLGADYTISTHDENIYDQAKEITSGKGFEYVYEAAGKPETLNYALKLAAKQAKICLLGTQSNDINFNYNIWNLINRKELNIEGFWMSYSRTFPGEEWNITKEGFEKGSLKFNKKMFYKEFLMKDAVKAFECFTNPNEHVRGRILLKAGQ